MSPKKAEPQFKLNYFDIIKGVLFPKMSAPPKPQTPPKPAQTATPPALPAQSNAPQLAAPVAKPVQTPPPQPAVATPIPAAKPVQAPPPQPVIATPIPAAKPVQTPPSQPVAATPAPAAKPAQKAATKTSGPVIKADKLAPAFFNIAGVLSFVVNIILIIVLIIVARELFALKAIVGDHLLGGLYANFIKMDQAHIKSTIPIDRQIPVEFSLPISQDTVVTLTEPTRINGAQVVINSGGLSINAPANIVLPAGTNLPVHLELTVPVKTEIPIKFDVPVDIPLEQTELHQPFVGLQDVVRPLFGLVSPLKSTANIPGCGIFNQVCNWFFYANPQK